MVENVYTVSVFLSNVYMNKIKFSIFNHLTAQQGKL